jgi:hypothetical protein
MMQKGKTFFSLSCTRLVCIPVLILVFCLFVQPAPAEASPPNHSVGIGDDKWVHFSMGMAINSVLMENKRISWLERQLIVIAVGALKETIDHSRGDRWDAGDFGATVLGGIMPKIQFVYRF